MDHKLCSQCSCYECHEVPLILREAIISISNRIDLIEKGLFLEEMKKLSAQQQIPRCSCQYQGQQAPMCPIHMGHTMGQRY